MTFPDVISKWPNAGELARDIKLNRGAVKQWRRRCSIPPEYWLEIESAARRRGIEGVTVFVLAEIAMAHGRQTTAA